MLLQLENELHILYTRIIRSSKQFSELGRADTFKAINFFPKTNFIRNIVFHSVRNQDTARKRLKLPSHHLHSGLVPTSSELIRVLSSGCVTGCHFYPSAYIPCTHSI